MPVLAVGLMQLLFGSASIQECENLLRHSIAYPAGPGVSTRLYDREGVLLATIGSSRIRRVPVKIGDVSMLTRLAFVCVEDERFYEHHGVDLRGMARAAVRDLKSGSVVEGGSTITQQLVKNRFLQSERTLRRKLQEVVLALELDGAFSKDQLLEQYLNEIYFGRGIYGIGAAALYYFGKTVASLDLAESAILAGMAKAPNRFNPLGRPEECRKRQLIVLLKLWQNRYIAWQDVERVMNAPVPLSPPELRRDLEEKAPYFVAMVRRELERTYGIRAVHGGGLQVTTTLSWPTQQLAEKSISEASIFKSRRTTASSPLNAALVVLDAASGEIRALVGGRDHVASQFDRATQARRQPGSAFKPIVYAAALFAGLSANEIVEDEPVIYEDQTLEQFWEPRNYGDEYHGSTTLAEALARSYNAVAVKLLEKVGIAETVALARRMGIASPLHHGLSLALGSDETTLLELSSAYSVFPNGGQLAEPHSVLMVRDAQGNLLHVEQPKVHDAMDVRTAYIMTRMLRGVVERGTGTAARVAGQVVAGKTGTTNSYADAWFIGFTPDVVAGCWVGNDDHTSLGGGRAGGQTAAPIVGEFLKTYLQDRPKRDFLVPDGIRDADVCSITGQLATADCEDTWNLAFEKEQLPRQECEYHGPMGMAGAGEDADPLAAGPAAGELPGMTPGGLSDLARRLSRERATPEFELPAEAWRPPETGTATLDLPSMSRREEPAAGEIVRELPPVARREETAAGATVRDLPEDEDDESAEDVPEAMPEE